MAFLPNSAALVIFGGRNDTVCAENITPMLNDLHLFLLDQKVWLQVKYSFDSERLSYVCNSSIAVISENQQDKIIIFGGIENRVKSESQLKHEIEFSEKETGIKPSAVSSCLTNRTFMVQVRQRTLEKQFFKVDQGKSINPARNYVQSLQQNN
jgi:hypothetical protein